MLGVLIRAKVGYRAASAMLGYNLSGDLLDDSDHLDEHLVFNLKREQGTDMPLRNHNNMHRPKRACMVIREHGVRFDDLLDGCSFAQHLITVKIL